MNAISDLRKILVEVLGESAISFELVVLAADTIKLDAQIDDWFLHHLKQSGSEDEIFKVLDTTDACSSRCVAAWKEYQEQNLDIQGFVAAVRSAHESLSAILPTTYSSNA